MAVGNVKYNIAYCFNSKAVLEKVHPELRGHLDFMDGMPADEQFLLVGEILLGNV